MSAIPERGPHPNSEGRSRGADLMTARGPAHDLIARVRSLLQEAWSSASSRASRPP
jgi:hypothetical protein